MACRPQVTAAHTLYPRCFRHSSRCAEPGSSFSTISIFASVILFPSLPGPPFGPAGDSRLKPRPCGSSHPPQAELAGEMAKWQETECPGPPPVRQEPRSRRSPARTGSAGESGSLSGDPRDRPPRRTVPCPRPWPPVRAAEPRRAGPRCTGAAAGRTAPPPPRSRRAPRVHHGDAAGDLLDDGQAVGDELSDNPSLTAPGPDQKPRTRGGLSGTTGAAGIPTLLHERD